MSRVTSRPEEHQNADEQLRGAERFGARSILGWLGVLLGVVPFLALWLLIRDSSSTLASLDRSIAAQLNESVRGSTVVVDTLHLVTELAGTATGVLVFTLITVFLAIQQRWRLAAFAATTGIGLAILIPASKALIGRARPMVDVPVADLPGSASFPSGHSMTAVVLWGTLVLIALPAVRRSARLWLVGCAVALVVVIGFTRLALGVHFLSDVLAGWALGTAWLAAMVVSFRTWPSASRGSWAVDPLQQEPDEVVDVEEPRRAVLGLAGRDLIWLAGAAVSVAAALVGLGLLMTGPWRDSWLGRWDREVVEFMVEVRSPAVTDVASVASALSGTSMVIAVALTVGVLALAATGTWRPMLFVAVAVAGEALLYFAVSRLVDRPRPDLADLTSGLPAAASWPSGHVAAAVVLYGSLATVVVVLSSSRIRWVSVALAVLIPLAVSVSRLYLAAHYPTDVMAGLVLGIAWLFACIRWLSPRASESSVTASRGDRFRAAMKRQDEPRVVLRDVRRA